MQLDELKNSILDAREKREQELKNCFLTEPSSVIMLSLNIPGKDKAPKGSIELFNWAFLTLTEQIDITIHIQQLDIAGHYGLFTSKMGPEDVKKIAVKVESSMPAARLLDIDVYDQNMRQISRTEIGLDQRICMVCDKPAVECIRTGNHAKDAVVQATIEQLSEFIKF